MQFKTMIILLVLLIYSNSSGGKKIPKYIRERFTNCYNGENTTIGNLIKIDGYYELKELYTTCSGVGEKRICRDTLNHNIVFYEDGTFIYNYWDLTTLNDVDTNVKNYKEVIVNRIKNSERYYATFFWGIYRIEGDTIITQRIFNAALFSLWDAWEDKYVIIDRTTIMILPSETRTLHWQSRQTRQTTIANMAERKFLPSKFKPSNKLPPPDSWLKKQSWTQCNGGRR